MKEVDFYFDFASPNAYLSLMAGKELEDKLGFKFNIKSDTSSVTPSIGGQSFNDALMAVTRHSSRNYYLIL